MGMNILATYRKKHGLTQEQFADMLGCSQGMITHIERGRRTFSPQVAIQVEQITAGEIKKSDLRPDIFTDSGNFSAA